MRISRSTNHPTGTAPPGNNNNPSTNQSFFIFCSLVSALAIWLLSSLSSFGFSRVPSGSNDATNCEREIIIKQRWQSFRMVYTRFTFGSNGFQRCVKQLLFKMESISNSFFLFLVTFKLHLQIIYPGHRVIAVLPFQENQRQQNFRTPSFRISLSTHPAHTLACHHYQDTIINASIHVDQPVPSSISTLQIWNHSLFRFTFSLTTLGSHPYQSPLHNMHPIPSTNLCLHLYL